MLVEAVAIDEELRLRVLGLEATLARIVTRWCEDAKDAGCIRPAVDPDVFGMLATKMLLPQRCGKSSDSGTRRCGIGIGRL